MSAVRIRTERSVSAITSMPSMPSVPLIRARPSLATSSTGVSPAAASASAAGISTPSASCTSPSPISASAQCESGARSPEQPREPYSCTTGVIPALSTAAISSATSGRTPVRPVASVERRSSISPRTTSRSTSGPEPAACERISDFCSWARISVGMCRVASAPKPVEMPYAGVGAAASSSTVARERTMAAGTRRQPHRRTPAGDRDDVLEGQGADPDRDCVRNRGRARQTHATIQRPAEGSKGHSLGTESVSGPDTGPAPASKGERCAQGAGGALLLLVALAGTACEAPLAPESKKADASSSLPLTGARHRPDGCAGLTVGHPAPSADGALVKVPKIPKRATSVRSWAPTSAGRSARRGWASRRSGRRARRCRSTRRAT